MHLIQTVAAQIYFSLATRMACVIDNTLHMHSKMASQRSRCCLVYLMRVSFPVVYVTDHVPPTRH